MQLQSMLIQRRVAGKSTTEQKQLMLVHIKQNKSLEYTMEVLEALHAELEREIDRLETAFGSDNFELRMLLEVLKV